MQKSRMTRNTKPKKEVVTMDHTIAQGVILSARFVSSASCADLWQGPSIPGIRTCNDHISKHDNVICLSSYLTASHCFSIVMHTPDLHYEYTQTILS